MNEKNYDKVLLMLLLVVLSQMSCLVAMAQGVYEFPEDVKPLIETRWSQGPPFNALCPTIEREDGVRMPMPAGCGPVAMAQIVNYHRYPSMSPDGEYEYEWRRMFRSLKPGLLESELVSVAKLLSDCGVSSFTDYGEKGSGTSISFLMGAMKRLFRYSNEMSMYDRRFFMTPERDSLFRQLIFRELKAGRPVVYQGFKDKKNGHLFIIDGCKKSKVHVNMGWGGYMDGYYDLDDIAGYNELQCLLVDVADSCYHAETAEVAVSSPGSLGSQLTPHDRKTVRHIKLSGKMDKSDIAVLRDMIRTGMLRTVNMEDADMDELPDSAFFECTYLSHFVGPRNLERIGNIAFRGCTNLNYAIFHEGLVKVGIGAFNGCVNLLGIHLPGTTVTISHGAFNSCIALLTVTVPEGVKSMGNYVFAHCRHLYSVNLPKSLQLVGKGIFQDCKRLSQIRLNPDNPYIYIDGDNELIQR